MNSMFPTTLEETVLENNYACPSGKKALLAILYQTLDFIPLFVVIVFLYYSKYMFIIFVYPQNMGIDKRGVLRGKCTECECEEVESVK